MDISLGAMVILKVGVADYRRCPKPGEFVQEVIMIDLFNILLVPIIQAGRLVNGDHGVFIRTQRLFKESYSIQC